MKNRMLLFAVLSLCSIRFDLVSGQAANRLVFDQAHGEQPPPPQMEAVAKKLGLEIQTSTVPITAEALKGARILYLRAPSGEFTPAESEAIVAFVKGADRCCWCWTRSGGSPWKRRE